MGWAARSHDALKRFEKRQREAQSREAFRTQARIKALAEQIQDDAQLARVLGQVPEAHRAASLELMRPFLGFEPCSSSSSALGAETPAEPSL